VRPAPGAGTGVVPDVALDCGWGRLVFGQTFADERTLGAVLRAEERGQRDICAYHPEPHVLVASAPHELFIDPSHTYRRWLAGDDLPGGAEHVVVVKATPADLETVNRIYLQAGMVTAPVEVLEANLGSGPFLHVVAKDPRDGRVVGTATGVDHLAAFGDPEAGSSVWAVAVEPQSQGAGVGQALTASLAAEMERRGRRFVDVTVLHDNAAARRLYERLGFVRVPMFCVKRKNPINERFFVPPPGPGFDRLNPYARIIADEARRRGIIVEVLDAEGGFLRLTYGGRSVVTRESLSELTSGVAVSWCDDKRVTRRVLAGAGLEVPRGVASATPEADAAFLAEVGEVVVKPARGEQGRGITVGVRHAGELPAAVDLARRHGPDVLLEELCPGEDVRVVVIDGAVVAAAVRRPATIVGDGSATVAELVAAESRRRAAATGGESSIPLDEATAATVRAAGHGMDDVLATGTSLAVRRTANLHTGGTIHDVTQRLHPSLGEAAVKAAEVLRLPVTGIDLLVPDLERPSYVVVEANERPGLANHEPQPTAQRFVDLLFPGTQALPRPWQPGTSAN